MRPKLVMASTAVATFINSFSAGQGVASTTNIDLTLAATEFELLDPNEPIQFSLAAVDEQSGVPADGDDWRAEFTAWIWLMGLNGDITTGPATANVDATFLDILDASDSLFALAGRLEIGKGKWGVFADGMWCSLGADDQSGPGGMANIDVTFDQGLLDFGLMYRVIDKPSEKSHRHATVDVYAGGRYQYLNLKLEPAMAATQERSRDWIDPIIGARLILPLSEKLDLLAGGDIGGFGVSSEFTWSAIAAIGLNFKLFNCPSTAYLGYKALGTDYSTGSDPARFEWDVIQHGPLLGLTVRF